MIAKCFVPLACFSPMLKLLLFNPIQDGMVKKHLTSFSPATSTNEWSSLKHFPAFSFNPFVGVKFQEQT